MEPTEDPEPIGDGSGPWSNQTSRRIVGDPEATLRAIQKDPTTAPAVQNVTRQAVKESLMPVTHIDGGQTVAAEELDRASDRDERRRLMALRDTFSVFLLWFMGAQLAFMNVVLVLVGIHAITITSSVLQFYLAGTFGEIVGLVTVAVKFLFSDKPFLGGHGK